MQGTILKTYQLNSILSAFLPQLQEQYTCQKQLVDQDDSESGDHVCGWI